MLHLRIVHPGLPGAFALMLGSLTISPQSQAYEEYQLPILGSTTASVSSEEFRLGRAWLRQFRAQAPQWQDPIVNDYLNGVIARLAPYSDLGSLNTTTVMVDNRTLNAFAVPGGVVGINAGLFLFADDEGEFVSVIAHELGHLSQRHYARGSARAEQTQLPAMAAMLAGMLIAVSGGGEAGIATAMGSQAAMIQDQLSYSRRFEQEADRVGLQAMASAGYDPDAMVRMFGAMLRMSRLQGDSPPEFLLSHPVSESRLSDAQARASQLHSDVDESERILYDMMRARALLNIYSNTPQQAASRLAQTGGSDAAQRYLEALIAARNGQTDTALQQIDQLAHELPDYGMLPASGAEIALDAQRFDDAISRSQRLLRLMPGYLPVQLTLAQAELQRDPQAAYELLQDVTSRHPDNPMAFDLLATAAGRSGENAWGHLARAEYLQLTGRVDSGIRQLTIARDTAEQEQNQRALAQIAQRRDAFLEYRETLEQF